MNFIKFYFKNPKNDRRDLFIIPVNAIRQVLIDPATNGKEIVVIHDHTKHEGTQLHREVYKTEMEAAIRINEIYHQLEDKNENTDENNS